MLDLLVKGFQLWEPGNKSEKIWIRKEWKTPLWMVCVQMRTKTMRERRNPGKKTSKIQESTTGETSSVPGHQVMIVTNLGFIESKCLIFNNL